MIEQGKVDGLLQATAKDRRAIFEEAAGISRFKAKKVEAQRRLERVEQNLLRLSDIVEEVESRLRSVRAQAAKAQRYREYSDRLQQLRTQVGVADWRRLSERLAALETELTGLRVQAAEVSQASDALEAQLQNVGTVVDQAGERLRTRESELARNREQISAREAAADEGRTRCAEFDEEAERHRQRLRAMTHRAGNLQGRLRTVEQDLAQAGQEYAEMSQRLAQHRQAAEDLSHHMDRIRQEAERAAENTLNGCGPSRPWGTASAGSSPPSPQPWKTSNGRRNGWPNWIAAPSFTPPNSTNPAAQN